MEDNNIQALVEVIGSARPIDCMILGVTIINIAAFIWLNIAIYLLNKKQTGLQLYDKYKDIYVTVYDSYQLSKKALNLMCVLLKNKELSKLETFKEDTTLLKNKIGRIAPLAMLLVDYKFTEDLEQIKKMLQELELCLFLIIQIMQRDKNRDVKPPYTFELIGQSDEELIRLILQEFDKISSIFSSSSANLTRFANMKFEIIDTNEKVLRRIHEICNINVKKKQK